MKIVRQLSRRCPTFDHGADISSIESLNRDDDVSRNEGRLFCTRGLGSSPPAHATVLMNNQTVDLLAIRGASHEDCIKHSNEILSLLPRRQVLLISRDRDNNPWEKRFGSFLQPESAQLGQERNITDSASGLLHFGYRKLLAIFQQSASAAALQGAINAELAA